MTINLYTGTPGSAKSLDAAREILVTLKHGRRNIITNFDINSKYKTKKFFYLPNNCIDPQFLMNFSTAYHKPGKENQTLLVLDECQYFFNPREFSRSDRLPWINFFTQHRKLGYEIILITQFDRLLDRQIRCLVEYEFKHRKVNNFGPIGALFPFKTFCRVQYWYGVKERIGCSFFIYRRKYGKLYDSYKMFK